MKWRIGWSRESVQVLSKLERIDAKRIVNRIEQAAEDPHRYFTRLRGHEDFKLRAGDYRVLALIDNTKETIFIEAIGHRKKIYKK